MMISLISLSAQAELVEVFTTSSYPVALNGLKANVCKLDALNTITADLNHNLSAIMAEKRINKIINSQLTDFYRCQALASFYQLQYLPAIVIDKTYVVYGMNTVDKALIASRHYNEVHHA